MQYNGRGAVPLGLKEFKAGTFRGLSLADRWGTTVDFTTSFLHPSRFSVFRSMIWNSVSQNNFWLVLLFLALVYKDLNHILVMFTNLIIFVKFT